jgi:hypothetical protein
MEKTTKGNTVMSILAIMSSAKVLFIIYSEKQKRTFIETGFASSRENLFKIDLLNSTKSPVTFEKNLSAIFDLKIPSFLSRSGTLLAVSFLWKNKNRTPAHRLRALSSFARKSLRPKHEGMILYQMNNWSEFKRLVVRLFSLPFIWNILARLRSLFVFFTFSTLLKKIQIDLKNYEAVCVPYSGQLSAEFDDFVNYFQKCGLLTIAIQENWDNLSTKTFSVSKPDYFLVWGKQSEGHLRVVHQNYTSLCEIIGSPRFIPYFDESYKTNSQVLSNLNLEGPYVLVTGTGDGIDDFQILSKSIEALRELRCYKEFSSLELVYRPHPYTRNPLSPMENDYLLKAAIKIDSREGSRDVFYHCPLVQNASLVINQFSTILLETLSANNKVLLPTFVNRPVNYGYEQSINEWCHLIGLETFPNVYFSYNREAFTQDIIDALHSKKSNSRVHSKWMCLDANANLQFNTFLSDKILLRKKANIS